MKQAASSVISVITVTLALPIGRKAQKEIMKPRAGVSCDVKTKTVRAGGARGQP